MCGQVGRAAPYQDKTISKRDSKKSRVLLERGGQKGRLERCAQLMLMVWRAASWWRHTHVGDDRLDEQLGGGGAGGGRGQSHQHLPGKDSGRRCAAVEGTRWKNR